MWWWHSGLLGLQFAVASLSDNSLGSPDIRDAAPEMVLDKFEGLDFRAVLS